LRRRAVAGTAEARPPEPVSSPVAQLKELDELREQGILTAKELAAEKRKLLGT
jgi:hypothetical protein